jgi:hypothetical protein
MSRKAIARVTDRSSNAVSMQIAKMKERRGTSHPRWTKAEDDTVLRMRAQGTSYAVIAGVLGTQRTAGATKQRYHIIRASNV